MGEGEGGGGKVMNFKVLKSFPPPLYPVTKESIID
jgi:hypothetical protein